MKLGITRRSLLAMGSSAALGIVTLKDAIVTGVLGQQARAQEGAQTKDNTPLGRKPTAIVDGNYPASYFPNTELLGLDEIRITALGTGMPN